MKTENLYELLLKKKAGLCSEEEEHQLDKRIADDPEARELWMEINADVDGVWSNPGTDDAWQKFQYSRIHMKPNKINPMYLKVAAIVAGLIITYVLGRSWSDSQRPHPTAQVDTTSSFIELPDGQYISLAGLDANLAQTSLRKDIPLIELSDYLPKGTLSCRIVGRSIEGYKFKLPDGSVARSNANTIFSFDFTAKSSRTLTMDGEMYLEVAADANRPFKVITSATQIDVLGTSFNVNTYGHTHRIALISGAVKISTGDTTVQLTPGHKAELTADHRLVISPSNANSETAWINGKYVFYNTPVTEVIEQLRSAFNMPIAHYNPTTDSSRISGEYNRETSPLEVAENLALINKSSYTYMQLRDTMVITYLPGLKKIIK